MNEYLLWIANETKGSWWNDSADIVDLKNAIAHGACGVTTNPVLICDIISKKPEMWEHCLKNISKDLSNREKGEEIIRAITCEITKMFYPIYQKTKGKQGYVCAQVDPRKAGNRDFMLNMAKRFASWAPNVACKLPTTLAGLDVLEECVSLGITVTATVSFTLPQVLAIGERHRRGAERARSNGIEPGQCFAVIMTGRVDDYIFDIVADRKLSIPDSDIRQCGIAITKRAYQMFRKRGYEAVLMPTGMRGEYHAEALSGGEMVMSINPKIQVMLPKLKAPYLEHIGDSVDAEVIDRLSQIPEFVQAYEPDGMIEEQFISCGMVQRTLSQFIEHWLRIENFQLHSFD